MSWYFTEEEIHDLLTYTDNIYLKFGADPKLHGIDHMDEIKKLQGNMYDAKINNGLFVSWSGYKRSVKERDFFFSVRLWGKNELLEALFNVYDKLDPDLKAEIPLKKIWSLTLEE